jgi:hypothetical protein
MVFLLDRSGSMAGEPLNAAKRALEMGLSLLQPQDCFAVVAFDHEQIWWKPSEWQGALGSIRGWIDKEITGDGLWGTLAGIHT